MLAWSSLLVQRIDLRVLGLAVLKLQVNRHRVAEVRSHEHPHGQAILYLSSAGRQMVGEKMFPAQTGDFFVIPPGASHGFHPLENKRPICLVLDFVPEETPRSRRLVHRRLEPSTLSALHGCISRIPRKGRLHLHDYVTITAVVALLFDPSRAVSDAAHERPVDSEPLRDRLRAILMESTRSNAFASIAELARRVGYHPDHLTRRMRRESGQSLREMRDSLRLEAATASLRAGASIADAGIAAGFGDPGYFGRWFRRKLGVTPSEHQRLRR